MAELGTWDIVGRSGVVGTHAALLYTGQILFFSRPEEPSHKWGPADNGLAGDATRLPTDPDVTLSTIFERIDPADYRAYRASPVVVEHNPFCAGHTFLPDGRLLVAGGDKRSHSPENLYPYNAAPLGTKYGTNRLRAFEPKPGATGAWKDLGTISDSRWYPTCTLLPDGRVYIVSGSIDDVTDYNTQNPTCENIPPHPDGPQYLPLLVEAWPYHSYPFVYVLPSGQLFLFVKDKAYFLREALDAFHRARWVVVDGPTLPTGAGIPSRAEPAKQYPNSGTSVLLPLLPEKNYAAEVLVIGGSGAEVFTQWDFTAVGLDASQTKWVTPQEASRELGIPETTLSQLIIAQDWATQPGPDGQPRIGIQRTLYVKALAHCFKLSCYPQPSRQWECVAPLNFGRVMPDAVLLPDGTVLVVNGCGKGYAGGYPGTGPMRAADAVKAAELYNPVTDEWQVLAEAALPRLYHGTALLLPDARVMVAGSDHQVHGEDRIFKIGTNERNQHLAASFEYQVEIFTPPYLRAGERPQIADAPAQITYGTAFRIEVPGLEELRLDSLRVALLLPGSVTHGNNMSQRHVGVKIQGRQGSQLELLAPPSAAIAPPTFYMLFLLRDGVPSHARFVQLCMGTEYVGGQCALPTAGLQAWYRADLGVVADSRGQVSTWADLSGQNNNAVWRTSSLPGQPERPPQLVHNELNGQPVIRFSVLSNSSTNALDPRGGHLETDNQHFLEGRSAYTIFAVAHPWGGGGFRSSAEGAIKGVGGIVGWGDYSTAEPNSVVALCVSSGPVVQRLPTSSSKALLTTYWDYRTPSHVGNMQLPVSLARPSLFESSYDGASAWMRINGSMPPPVPAAGKNTGSGPLTIGRTGSFQNQTKDPNQEPMGEFFRGDIAEIIIYDTILSNEERLQVETYLRNRYRLD